jgi:hypothetical protein
VKFSPTLLFLALFVWMAAPALAEEAPAAGMANPHAAPLAPPLPGHGKMPGSGDSKDWHLPGAVTPPAELDFSGIERVEGGKTVAEIYDQSEALAGTTVSVRGRVVKVNKAIMKHNWVHLRDGTTSADGENDLTVTTEEVPDVGATVVATGKLGIDRDFGFNYRYDVLLEEATIKVESKGEATAEAAGN